MSMSVCVYAIAGQMYVVSREQPCLDARMGSSDVHEPHFHRDVNYPGGDVFCVGSYGKHTPPIWMSDYVKEWDV